MNDDFKKQLFLDACFDTKTKDYVCMYCKYFHKNKEPRRYKNLKSFKAHLKTKKHNQIVKDRIINDMVDARLTDYYTINNEYYIPDIGKIIYDYVGRLDSKTYKPRVNIMQVNLIEEQFNGGISFETMMLMYRDD